MRHLYKRFPTKLGFLGILLAAMVFFQNCEFAAAPGLNVNGTATAAASHDGGNGNGNGYDGKPYSHLKDSGTCPDGSLVDSRIEFRKGVAYLAKDDCQEIPVASQVPVTVTKNLSDTSYVFYQNRKYVDSTALFSETRRDSAGNALFVGNQLFVVKPEDSFSFIGKISVSGQLLWSKKSPVFGDEASPQQILTAVREAKDGTIISAGSYADGAHPVNHNGLLIAHFDGAGNQLSGSALMGDFPAGASPLANEITTDSLGSSYVAGSLFQNPGSQVVTAFIVKLGANGAIIWQRELRAPGLIVTKLEVTPDSSAIYAIGNDLSKTSVFKISSAGQLLWSKSFPVDPNLVVNRLLIARDGNILVTGSTPVNVGTQRVSAPLIAKLSSATGALVWANFIAPTTIATKADIYFGTFFSVTERPDGSLLAGGGVSTYPGGGAAQARVGVLVSMSSTGVVAWGLDYSKTQSYDTFQSGAVLPANGKILLIDSIIAQGAPRAADVEPNTYGQLVVLADAPQQTGCALCTARTNLTARTVTFTMVDSLVPTTNPTFNNVRSVSLDFQNGNVPLSPND